MAHRILFIHHSTGANLLKEGNVRKILKNTNPAIELWDHSYNLDNFMPSFLARYSFHTGLSDNNGKITGTDYNIVLSNNSPKEYGEIFSRNSTDKTLKSILSYDIIAFKNCYPTTKITSNSQLDEYKQYYEAIRDIVVKYVDKKFIFVTPPPLRKELNALENAQRAKSLVQWLVSKEFIKSVNNIFVFDLFTLLSNENGYLRKEYQRIIPIDSHPNKKANIIIGPIFSKYISDLA